MEPYDPDAPVMLVSDPNLTIEKAAIEVAELLVGIVLVAPEGPIERTYPYEPGLLEDAYPNLTCQHTGWRRVPGGIDEVRLPRLFTYTVRSYYPVLDDDENVDGLLVAQRQTLKAISHFDERLFLDEPKGYQSLGQRVRWADAGAGRVRGASEGGLILYSYEADVEVYLH